MRTIQRFIAICTLITPCILMAQPSAAFQACCSCVVEGKNVCLTSAVGSCETISDDYSENSHLKDAACSTISAENCLGEDDDASTESAPTIGRVDICTEVADAGTYTGLAQPTEAAPDEFEPVIPNLEIKIPGLDFAEEFQISGAGTKEQVHLPFLAQYISAVYKYLVGVSVIAAAVMIVYGGFLYIIGGTFTAVNKGKDIIWDAIIGLFLVFALFTIVETLNPEITNLKSLDISYVATEPFTMEELEDWAEGSTGSAGEAQPICNTIESCRQRCITNDWPPAWPGIMNPDDVHPIPDIEGALQGNGFRASNQVIAGLNNAARVARDKKHTILVRSGYRTLRTQIKLVCDRMGNAAREAGIGHAVAWPGSSNHGSGTAVDVALMDNTTGKVVVRAGNCAGQANGTTVTAEASRILDEIMTSSEGGNGVRYSNETWHYEFGSASSCRCKFPNCPAPPRSCNAGCGN